MPKTRIRGIGFKFDTDPPKKYQRLEFEGSGSNLTRSSEKIPMTRIRGIGYKFDTDPPNRAV